MIKYNVKTVNDWLYNSNPIKKLYYNGMVRYRRFVANGQPTPPVFDGKWKATYQDGHVESAECDSSSEIGRNEINLTNLVSIEIGSCVTSINEWSFGSCSSLTSVTIPNSVTTIGNYAFSQSSGLKRLNSNTDGVFNFPSGVTYIGSQCFYNCTGVTTVTIPSGVTSISPAIFMDCHNLTSVIIPNSVTRIHTNAFTNCSSLTSIDIPSGVTMIGNYVFENCSALTSITCNAVTPPTISSYDTLYNTNNCPIYVPSQSVEAYKTATYWRGYASRIKPISEKPQ